MWGEDEQQHSRRSPGCFFLFSRDLRLEKSAEITRLQLTIDYPCPLCVCCVYRYILVGCARTRTHTIGRGKWTPARGVEQRARKVEREFSDTRALDACICVDARVRTRAE